VNGESDREGMLPNHTQTHCNHLAGRAFAPLINDAHDGRGNLGTAAWPEPRVQESRSARCNAHERNSASRIGEKVSLPPRSGSS
jgi:hypothetical protein